MWLINTFNKQPRNLIEFHLVVLVASRRGVQGMHLGAATLVMAVDISTHPMHVALRRGSNVIIV